MTAIDTLGVLDIGDVTRLFRPLSASSDPALVGEKAHALGRMMRAGLAVPDGIVITVHGLEMHLAEHAMCHPDGRGEGSALHAGLAIIDLASVERVASAPLPPGLREMLVGQAQSLLARGPVVVRSSAIGEDAPGQSFAGQLDSILHVRTADELDDAVRRCWSSYWSERALFYRRAQNVASSGMAVIVQQQVDAVAAGVLFTATTNGPMLVEYAPGLGDAVVSGAVDPARAMIDRTSGALCELSGTDLRLDASHVRQLHRIGLAVEREFGGPQDVEWALGRDGTLYVVQSRPITASVTLPVETRQQRRPIVWSNANMNENFPAPVSPLLYSIASAGYTHYFRNLARAFGIAAYRIRAMEPAFQQIIGVHGARMYYNLTSIHSVLRLAPFGGMLTRSFDSFVGADSTGVEAGSTTRRSRLRQIGEVAVIAAKTTRLFVRLDARIARFERTVDEFADRTRPASLSRMSLGELGQALADFVEIRCNKWLDASLGDAASMICYGALERLLRRANQGNGHTSLLKAIPGVVSGEPVIQLWRLSRLIRDDHDLFDIVEHSSADDALSAIRSDPRFAEFRAAFERYLDDWGFRCSGELMLTSPSFQENPAPLIDMLRSYARMTGDSPADALRTQAAEREAATRRVLQDLRHHEPSEGSAFRVVLRGLVKASVLRVLLPWTHAAIRFRERARLKQSLLYSRCRRIALALGDELSRRGLLAARDDVFFLTAPELIELSRGSALVPGSVRETVEVRRAEHRRLSALTPPDCFTLEEGELFDTPRSHCEMREAPPSDPVCHHERSEGSAVGLTGTAACGGRATGRATVLASVTESDRLAKGDILVTKQTDPGWGPVFFLISGLVIERGGMLSHGAIIAREFGIPCVVGIRNAMQQIRSGATVTVDGDRGVVHVVD